MTVGELYELLGELPAATLVLVEASEPEMGYVQFTLQHIDVAPCEPEGYWDGEFQDSARARESDLRQPAVILRRHHEKLP